MTPINFGLPGFFRAITTSSESVESFVFTPISTNLSFFLDAQTGIYTDAGSTSATNGDTIQQINDQSGAGITATNTQSGYQATYDVSTINGLNTIRLENDNALDTYFLSSNVDVSNLFTIHVVYKKDAVSDNALFLSAGQQLMEDSANSGFYLLQASSGAFSEGDDWTVATFRQNKGTDGKHYLYANGILMTEYTNNAPTTQAIDRLFQRPSARIGEFNVGDILIYDESQSLEDIATIHNGLNTKYGDLFSPTDTTLPTPPTISSTTLDLYVNPDYNNYSDIGKTSTTNTDYVSSARLTTGDFQSLYQHTAAYQVQWKNTVMPNSKASHYKAHQDSLQLSEDLTFTSSESHVVYSVNKRSTTNTGIAAVIGKYGTYNNSIFWNNSTMYFADGSTYKSTSNPLTEDVVAVQAFVVDRSAGLFRIYENGSQVGTIDISTLSADVNYRQLYQRHNHAASDQDFGITLVYRGLHDATDVGTVSDWLNNYYKNTIYTNAPITTNLLLHINVDADNTYSDEGTTLATDGDNLRQINDLSFDKNNISQSTASNQLAYETEFFNKKDFAKHLSQDYMNPSTSFNLAGGTIYVTGQKALESSDWVIVGGDSSGVAASNWSDGNTYLRDSSNNLVSLSIGHFVEHAVYAFVWDYGNTYEVFKNGVSLGSVDASSVGTLNNVKIFGRGQETATSENYFGDILVYSDAHTSTQVEEISNFLIGETYEVDSYTKEPTYKKFLVHHFEAESSSLKTSGATPTNGDSIASVNDLTFNDNDGTVSSTAPTYYDSVSDINDKAYLQLGGGSGVVNLSTPITMERTEDFTIFAVVKKDSTSDALALYGGDNNIALFSDYSDGNMYFLNGSNSATVSSLGTGWAIISAVYDAKADTLKVYKNGSQVGTTQSWSIPGSYTINRLFNRGNTTTTSGSGVAECMFYKTKLSSTEIAAEESRLNTKYDIY